MPRPLRSSCDRCHSQKLRCPKEPGVATCTRCLKADARCVFSPAGPAARRAASATTPTHDGGFSFQQTPLDNGLGMQFDWQQLDFDYTLNPPLEAAQDAQSRAIQEEAASSNPSPENQRSTYVTQLTNVAAGLDQICQGIPNPSIFHTSKDLPLEEVIGRYTKTFDSQRLLEVLFSSAQVLMDIYPDILELILGSEIHVEVCQNPDRLRLASDPPISDDDVPWSAEEVSDKLDIFLFNLLVLCHSRLLDIFKTLVSHATLCAKIRMAYPTGKEPRVNVPELRVGNFVASASSSSTMQAVLLAHVASVLKTRSQQLSKKVLEAIGNESSDKQSQMLKLQCEVLEEDSGNRVKQLHQVKELLNELGFPT